MILTLADLAYLGKVYDAVKSDNPPQLTDICPECDERVNEGDDFHITLNTAIPAYFVTHPDTWGEPNALGMTREDAPIVLIGCEGAHTVQF